jgi:hypothetical protein
MGIGVAIVQTSYIDSPTSAVSGANAAQLIKPIKKQKKTVVAPRKNLTNSTAQLTGCISQVSAPEPQEQSYFDALDDYFIRHQQAQDYLVNEERQTARDYMSAGDSPREPDHGLLGDDGEPVKFAQISDDDIDNCGYLGWLRH